MENKPQRNAELAYRVLDHIDAHPETWHQDVYICKTECGTGGCFAGWTTFLSGATPSYSEESALVTSLVFVNGRLERVGSLAKNLLGLPSYSVEATDLFNPENSQEDLGRLVREIFGPRPKR
jgi:hypothetical protein